MKFIVYKVICLIQNIIITIEYTTKISVNCVNPGAVRTKMREEAYPAEDPETNPLPKEIMNLYIYLMSDASKGINGQSINAQ